MVNDVDVEPVEVHKLFQFKGEFLVHLINIQGGGNDAAYLVCHFQFLAAKSFYFLKPLTLANFSDELFVGGLQLECSFSYPNL